MTVEFMPKDILHIKSLGFDGLSGYSPIRLMRSDLGNEKSSSEFHSKFFAAGANMGGVLKMKGKLSPEAKERLRNQVQTEYQGNSNAFKLMMLEEGWDFEKFGVAPDNGQLVESRKLLIRKIAAVFKVPPHKVGDDTRTGYNSLEQENRAFYTECINPYLRRIEEQFNLKLLSEAERSTVYFEFNRMGFLQADLSTQTQHFHLMLQNGVYLRNEVREYLGLNAIEGGDVPVTPLNMKEGNTQGTEEVRGENE